MLTPCPLRAYAAIMGAFIFITIILWSSNKNIQQAPEVRKAVDEKHLYSFLNPGLENCDELFQQKTSANLEFQREYNRLNVTIQAELNYLEAQKVYVEGHIAELQKQTLTYWTFAKANFVKTICETGFNAGHSALLFLSTKADIHVYSFDLAAHPYARPMADLIKKSFPGRLHITWGDSKVTVPAFAKSNPQVKCDIVIVDGGHNYTEAKADLRNLRALAQRTHHILVLDDYPGNRPGVRKAWQEELSTNQLKQQFSCNFFSDRTRGFTVGQYINL